jgi:hypothetical protein
MPQPLLDRAGRLVVVCLLIAGVGLSVTALVASLVHHESGQAVAYVAVSAALAAAAVLVWRKVRWVTLVCLVGLAGQALAVAGTLWELTHPVETIKAVQLRAIGIDPTTATTINLIYSTAAFGVFCWLAGRWWTNNRRTFARREHPAARETDGPLAG